MTKKQLLKMFKEDTMADMIQVTVQQSKKQKLTKRVFANDEEKEDPSFIGQKPVIK